MRRSMPVAHYLKRPRRELWIDLDDILAEMNLQEFKEFQKQAKLKGLNLAEYAAYLLNQEAAAAGRKPDCTVEYRWVDQN